MKKTNIILPSSNADIDLLFKQYYPRLCTYATRFVGMETARDLVMDCFLKLWEKQETMKDISLPSLLFVMVRNRCLNHLKQKRITYFESIDYLANLADEEKLYNFDFRFEGENLLLYKELQEQIDHVLNTLPPTCKTVFYKSRFEGKKNKEIAQEMNTSIKSIEKHITKALAAFSAYFKSKYPLDKLTLIIAVLLSIYADF